MPGYGEIDDRRRRHNGGALKTDPATEEWPREVAAEHATDSVPVAAPAQSAGEVRGALVGERFECADDIAVLEGEGLVGLVEMEALLAAPSEARIAEIMDPDPAVVRPGVDQEKAAWHMVEHGESSIAVVDLEGRFRGLIPPHRMLEVLLAEHDEDLARLGGYRASTQLARRAAEEAVLRRILHRLPWLLIGLAGAMASAVIVGSFEEQLDAKVLLAFFVPAVVYMADAVGTQTETVLIRGLSAGVAVRDVVLRELASGIVLGVIVGAAFLPFALIGWGDASVAVAVALALFASCSIATAVAMVLPWLFQRFDADPAFGSGPLATVAQDLLSIAVYLLIVTELAA